MDTINEIKRQELPEEQEIDLIELARKNCGKSVSSY